MAVVSSTDRYLSILVYTCTHHSNKLTTDFVVIASRYVHTYIIHLHSLTMKKKNIRSTDGSRRNIIILALIVILVVCSFLPVASSSTINSSGVLDGADAGDDGFFLYKGQGTPVPRSVKHFVVDSSVSVEYERV